MINDAGVVDHLSQHEIVHAPLRHASFSRKQRFQSLLQPGKVKVSGNGCGAGGDLQHVTEGHLRSRLCCHLKSFTEIPGDIPVLPKKAHCRQMG